MFRRIASILLAIVLLGGAACASNTRMDRGRFYIGAYVLNPNARTEEHVRDLAECGIDFIEDMEYDPAALDLFAQYGVGAILAGVVPGWWGGAGENAGQLAAQIPLSEYEAAAASFADHPAVWGIDVGDEPSALDFPQYGKVVDTVNEFFPNQFAFLNLHPYYAQALETALGTPTYEEYINEYCANVGTDYICYDFYVYADNVPDAYENLRIVADACRDTERSFWIVLQVNSAEAERFTPRNELRFQAYTAMAFGAETVLWSCYSPGWWENNVLDETGGKTEQYEKLKQVNAELHALAEPYMRYRRESTHFVGFDGTPWLEGVGQSSEPEFQNDFFENVRAGDGRPLLIGDLAPCALGEDGRRALFVCACDDPYDQNPTATRVLFRVTDGNVRAFVGDGERPVARLGEGLFAVEIASNEGILIELY